MKTTKYLIGCDPELFVKNKTSGQFISGHTLIRGDKRDPFPVDKGAVQVDGMALEFNTDPAKSADEFVHNVYTVLGQLRGMTPGYDLVAQPVARFDATYFQSVPKFAKALGCDPDMNAWTGDYNDPPRTDEPFRTGSGHIHIGWTSGVDPRAPDHLAICREIVKQLDYYLGVPSLLWDADNTRRMLYGKAGAFRPKPYGVEYRVLSNAWLNSEVLMRWVYNSTIKAVEDLDNGSAMVDHYGDVAREIIDNGMVDWPKKFDIEIGLPMPKLKAA